MRLNGVVSRYISQRLGRRGTLLTLLGVAYGLYGVGQFVTVPSSRFGNLGPALTGLLNSHIAGWMWVVGGGIGVIFGVKPRRHSDGPGFIAVFIPLLVWTICYDISWIAGLATDDSYGNANAWVTSVVWAAQAAVLLDGPTPRSAWKAAMVSEGVRVALITGGLVFLGSVVAYFGVRFTVRSSRQAQAEARTLEDSKVAAAVAAEKATVEAQAYERAAKHLLTTIAELRTDVSNLRTAQAEDSQRHRREMAEQDDRHRKQIAELREERRDQIAGLNERLDDMEAQRSNDRRLIESLNSYIRQLLRLLRDREIVPPPAPRGMSFDTD